MKNEIYILIELSDFMGKADITSRFLHVSREDKKKTIVKSEWNYLGTGPISISIKEDDGSKIFSFTSKDDSPRKFFCEDMEEEDYVEGEVLQEGKEIGKFIFRKVPDTAKPLQDDEDD